MYLRIKIGRYAGEIREFAPTVARDLLDSGRAENPFADQPIPVVKPKAGKKAGRQ